MDLPSNFQIGQVVRVGKRRGKVTEVIFGVYDDPEYGEVAKVSYTVEGIGTVLSGEVQEAPQIAAVP